MDIDHLEEQILGAMREYFKPDKRCISHAEQVLTYAKDLLKKEKGDTEVVIPTAILHDIGIKECERKYNSTGGQLQEREGPPIARKILQALNVQDIIIDEVCQIIGSHHSPGEVDTLNFRILWDADWLVNLKDEFDVDNKEKVRKIIDKVFMTETGKKKAKEIYLEK